MRRLFILAFLALFADASLLPVGGRADGITVPGRLTHPDGSSILIEAIQARDDSIVLAVTIANPSPRDIVLNARRSFVLKDGARGVHYLNPPSDNPELRIAAGSQVRGQLVFVGPPDPGGRQLVISVNDGIGTTDNPNDDIPAFRAVIAARAGSDHAPVLAQAEHPDGVTLSISRAEATPNGCLVSFLAANGNEKPILLNRKNGLMLGDAQGARAAVRPPAGNSELTIPPDNRISGQLLFPCQSLDAKSPLTLTSNSGSGGTADNPFETWPVLTLSLRPTPSDDSSADASSVTTSPIDRSRLVPMNAVADSRSGTPPSAANAAPSPLAAPPPQTVTPQTVTPQAATPPAATPARPPQPAPITPAAPSPVTAAPSAAAPAAPPASPAPLSRHAPRSLAQLKAALHVESIDHGFRLVVAADDLFGLNGASLQAEADSELQDIAQLIADTHTRDVVIAGHTDSNGNDDDNQKLSQQRADAVGGWLTAHGGKRPAEFVEKGYGRTRPMAPNHNADGSDNPQGRAKNRRIEITLMRASDDASRETP